MVALVQSWLCEGRSRPIENRRERLSCLRSANDRGHAYRRNQPEKKGSEADAVHFNVDVGGRIILLCDRFRTNHSDSDGADEECLCHDHGQELGRSICSKSACRHQAYFAEFYSLGPRIRTA